MAKRKAVTEKKPNLPAEGIPVDQDGWRTDLPRPVAADDDLAIPSFLIRKRDPNAPKPDLKLIMGGKPDWIMPDPNKVREEAPVPLFIDNRDAPVTVAYIKPKKRNVVVRNKKGKLIKEPSAADEIVIIANYDNMADFEAKHDTKSYPVNAKLLRCNKTMTMIFVTPKPWVAKMGPVPGINDDASPATAAQVREKTPRAPRVARSFDQPDAPGKPVADGSSLAVILRLMMAGTKTMDQIVKESGVEGGVLSAEDKVVHRVRFVLFKQHGVGHTVDAEDRISAVLPAGFDAASMFKTPKAAGKPVPADNKADVAAAKSRKDNVVAVNPKAKAKSKKKV